MQLSIRSDTLLLRICLKISPMFDMYKNFLDIKISELAKDIHREQIRTIKILKAYYDKNEGNPLLA